MPIVVTCPKCQAKLRGPDEMAGKSVRCKSCQEKFRAPGGKTGSVSDTQQLSFVGSTLALPAVAAAAVPPAPRAPAGTADDPLPLNDLIVEDAPPLVAPKAAVPLGGKADAVGADDLILEEPAKPAVDPFSFDEPAPEVVKKKRQKSDDGDERPKKKRGVDDEPADEKAGYQRRKSGTPWGLLLGIGAAVLVLGGGAAAVFLLGDKKKDEAKAPPPPEPKGKQPKNKAKTNPEPKPSEQPGGEPKPPEPTPPGAVKPPVDPIPPKKDPPKTEPPKTDPPPAEGKLPDPPAGNLTVVAKPKAGFVADLPADKVRYFAAGGKRLVVAFNSKPGFQGAGVIDTVRQYSTATGAKGREFELDSSGLDWPRPFAVSGTDEMVAVVSGGPNRATVYDFEVGNLLFDKADLFEGLTDRVGPVAALVLGADRKLFVVDQAGTVDVWDMSTRTRAVTGTPAKRTAPGKPAARACGAGSGAAVALDGKIRLVNESGAAVGSVTGLPAGAGPVLAMGTGAGPNRLAVAYALPGGKVGVAAVSAANGQVTYHTTLPEGAGAAAEVSWPADTLLAVTTDNGAAGFLVDIEVRQVTAYLKAPSTKVRLSPTGDDFWWLLADGPKAALTAAELPFDGYFDVAKQAGNVRRPVYLVPRADGLAK